MPKRNKGAGLEYRAERGVWEIIWYERGQRRRKSTGHSDRAQADQALGRFLTEQAAAKEGPRDPSQRRILDILLSYQTEHAPSCNSESTIGYSVMALIPFWGDLMVSAITKQTCRAYAKSRDGMSGFTIRRELATLSAAITHDHEEGRLLNKVPVFLPPPPDHKDRWLTRSEAAALLWAARSDPRSRLHLPLFIMMGLYTAARKEAILSLRWPQVDLDRRQIDFSVLGRAKTNKGRAKIPIPNRLLTFLRLARKRSSETGYVIEYFGCSIKTLRRDKEAAHGRAVKNIRHAFVTAAANAGLGEWKERRSKRNPKIMERYAVSDVTPHVLRHTCASWMTQGRLPWAVIAGYLGHEDERTTRRIYAHHHPDHLSEAVALLDRKRS